MKINLGGTLFNKKWVTVMKNQVNDLQMNLNGEHWEYNTFGSLAIGGKYGALAGMAGNTNNAELEATMFYNADGHEKQFTFEYKGYNRGINTQANFIKHYFAFLNQENNIKRNETSKSIVDELEHLYEMYEKGIISNDEFNKLKARMI